MARIGSIRSSPRPPPRSTRGVSRELHYFGSARVPELSRDVRYLLVSSLAHEPIEPLKWGMAQNHIGS
jgi:hypothetical protein